MTPEQKAYYENQLRQIRNGGVNHTAAMIDSIPGMGSYNLGPVDPPVVAFGNDDDPYYEQYFQNWDEVEAMIAHLRAEATKAWGLRNKEE